MIRQAISCDICGTEKRQTNHWFVVCEQAGELRVSGWNSRNRLRPGSKHLCGQTCLHKLIDEFMAKTFAAHPEVAAGAKSGAIPSSDIALTSNAVFADEELEFESSARLLSSPVLPATHVPGSPPAELLAMPNHVPMDDRSLPLPEEEPGFASRNWRIEAWKREREREVRGGADRSILPARRRSGM